MYDVLWAIFFGVVVTFGLFIVVKTALRAGSGVRGFIARRFPNVTDGDIKYFLHVVRMWAAFGFLLWLGAAALQFPREGGRTVLAVYVFAVAIGVPTIMHWFWQRSH